MYLEYEYVDRTPNERGGGERGCVSMRVSERETHTRNLKYFKRENKWLSAEKNKTNKNFKYFDRAVSEKTVREQRESREREREKGLDGAASGRERERQRARETTPHARTLQIC